MSPMESKARLRLPADVASPSFRLARMDGRLAVCGCSSGSRCSFPTYPSGLAIETLHGQGYLPGRIAVDVKERAVVDPAEAKVSNSRVLSSTHRFEELVQSLNIVAPPNPRPSMKRPAYRHPRFPEEAACIIPPMPAKKAAKAPPCMTDTIFAERLACASSSPESPYMLAHSISTWPTL
ncbi:hypothetical protein KC334_g43 [Hortaea werneckii]|nr:hypothetical protein KC334_g43 [Hortaea werneckii]